MRKRLSLVAAGLLAGATMSMTAASPAHAQVCYSDGDPILGYVCMILNNAPEPGPTVDHYVYVATSTVHWAYCQASPHC